MTIAASAQPSLKDSDDVRCLSVEWHNRLTDSQFEILQKQIFVEHREN